jgi:hypothetical protein
MVGHVGAINATADGHLGCVVLSTIVCIYC